MHIKLEVSFPSGARVELSKSDVEKVSKFIHDMLFTTVKPVAVSVIKKRKKVKNYIFWTEADKATLKEIASMPSGVDKTRAIRQFSLQSGHSRSSIGTRMYRLKTEEKNTPTPVFFH